MSGMTPAPVPQDIIDAFVLAAREGNLTAAVEILDEYGTHFIDKSGASDDIGKTALMWASGKGHVDMVEWLLEKGAVVDAQDNRGWTALMWAACFERKAVVAVLLENGASPDIETKAGTSAKVFAERRGAEDILGLMRQDGEAHRQRKEARQREKDLAFRARAAGIADARMKKLKQHRTAMFKFPRP